MLKNNKAVIEKRRDRYAIQEMQIFTTQICMWACLFNRIKGGDDDGEDNLIYLTHL
jgi:hypothetical protein